MRFIEGYIKGIKYVVRLKTSENREAGLVRL